MNAKTRAKGFRRMDHLKLFQQSLGMALILVFTSGCSTNTSIPTLVPPTPTPTPTPIVTGIEGKVYFADTDEPIPDVIMELNNPQLGQQQKPDLTIAKTTTDLQGRYSFTDIVPGTYVISLNLVTETRVSSIDFTVADNGRKFLGESDDGSFFAFFVEPEFVVPLGEIVQEDFVVHK